MYTPNSSNLKILQNWASGESTAWKSRFSDPDYNNTVLSIHSNQLDIAC